MKTFDPIAYKKMVKEHQEKDDVSGRFKAEKKGTT